MQAWFGHEKKRTKERLTIFSLPVRLMMEHRHIHVSDGHWDVTMVHSIWERGSDHDIRALTREVKKNPKAADAVRRAVSSSQVYGWPRFFKLFLE